MTFTKINIVESNQSRTTATKKTKLTVQSSKLTPDTINLSMEKCNRESIFSWAKTKFLNNNFFFLFQWKNQKLSKKLHVSNGIKIRQKLSSI